eukprot:m.386060 g.386060  ORF g.386060 m.386060 type:complete len:174 (+) comp21012_c0_seq10:156-677(+)
MLCMPTTMAVFVPVSSEHQLELFKMAKDGKTEEEIFEQAQKFRQEELAAGIDSSEKRVNELSVRKRAPSLSKKLGSKASGVMGKMRTRLSSLSVKKSSTKNTKSSFETDDSATKRQRSRKTASMVSRGDSDDEDTSSSAVGTSSNGCVRLCTVNINAVFPLPVLVEVSVQQVK